MTNLPHKQTQLGEDIYSRELNHRTSNLLQHALAALHFAGRGKVQHLPEAIDRLSGGAELQRLLATVDAGRTELTEHLRAVGSAACRMVGAADTVNFVLDGRCLEVPSSVARVVAMAVAEVVGNAIRHGIADRLGGSVILSLRDDGERTTILIDDDGIGGGWSRPGGQGRAIVDALIGELGGSVRRERLHTGFSRVRMEMPSLAGSGSRRADAECRSWA